MFTARTLCRSSAPLRQAFRSYATDTTVSKTIPSPSSSSSYLPLIIGVAGAGSGLAGYQFLGNRGAHADAPAEAKKAFTGGDQGFFDLKLEKVESYNHDTKKLRFSLPEEDMVSGLSVASAILTKFKAPDAEKPTLRPYTPVSDEGDKGHVDLLVKVYPDGVMSQHLGSLKPGETISFKGPLPKYPWTENKHDHITLISGGTGITPMYQLIRAIFNNPNDKTKVSLVFGNKTAEDILLKEEFDELEKKYPERFRTFYTLDKPPKSWPSGSGFISKELLKEVIPDPKSENIKVFVCGPPGLYKAVSGPKKSPQDQGELDGVLKELGYTKDQVYKF